MHYLQHPPPEELAPKSYKERVRDYEDRKEEKLKKAEKLVNKFKHEK
jgi:hypothetical protein